MGGLPAEIVETLRASYEFELSDAEPLTGGWDVHVDTWLVRSELGPAVVRRDRAVTLASAEWLGALLETARSGVPVSLPLRTRDGAAGARLEDNAVTVRPFVEGRTVDRDRPHEVGAAAGVLARLHAGLRGFGRARPDRSLWHPALWPGDEDPEPLRDRELDRFEAALAGDRRFADTVIHGDYWADNLIWSAGRVAAVIDWSEARHDKAVRELARATWEFGHSSEEDDLDLERARVFLGAYREAAGGFERGTAEVLLPLMRHELRLNARYAYWQAECQHDAAEREYADGLARAFARLRDLDSALLLG
jgi:Ser/Thr protein kinase RdoA (MazF antagonist)